jgi:stage IV sporulation protein FB
MDAPFLPKYRPAETTRSPWLSSAISLLAYVLVASLLIKDLTVALILILILVFHECGHYIAMRYYRYHQTGIFFIPLLGAWVSGSKRTLSQRESATIILAGPLPGILVGILLLLFTRYVALDGSTNAVLNWSGVALVLLNGFNLLPIYPLDGGQLLNRVLLNEESWLSKAFVLLSALLMTWMALSLRFYALLLFPLLLLWRNRKDKHLSVVEERVAAAGIPTDLDYEQLPDEDYWKIRAILIDHHPRFASVDRSRTNYDSKEATVQRIIASLLDRKLIMDLPLTNKIMLATLWTAALLVTALIALLSTKNLS